MANKGPHTNGSQFFILFAPAPHLDGKNTVFGKLVGPDAMETLKKLEEIEADAKGKVKAEAKIRNTASFVTAPLRRADSCGTLLPFDDPCRWSVKMASHERYCRLCNPQTFRAFLRLADIYKTESACEATTAHRVVAMGLYNFQVTVTVLVAGLGHR
ncbi:MAG: hypothetical protein LQ341_006393 [Variospora aurantia]|nr:MAG: hypothetical protein LQ341_006393 [Variospora aurantia]